jgi:mannan endo-1,4-beta-mannosidase
MEVFMNIVRLVRQSVILFCIFALSPGSTVWAGPASADRNAAATGFHVSGRFLLDANGNNFLMRGINHPHTWFPDETSSFASIKAKRANTVRVVLSSGKRWAKNSANDVTKVVNLCKTNKLVCVLEVHDTTGYGEQPGAASLTQAVNYWKSIKSALTGQGQEAYVIINIGNEPYGNINPAGWVAATKNAIVAMRNAGFHHMLMVDAPNWGQDSTFIMRNKAASIFNSDPDKNTVFSIHMFGVFDTAAEIQDYISTFVTNGLPLVIGEFGWNHTDGNPDEDAILSIARANGIGYAGWSWSGNSDEVKDLDMVVKFDPNRETPWGSRLIHGKDGIVETSCEASVYGSGPNLILCSTFRSVGAQDGWILESGENSSQGGSVVATTTTFLLGDDASNRQYRSILHFNTTSLPDTAQIVRIIIQIRRQSLVGTNPFTTHLKLAVDIRKGPFSNAAALQLTDFQAVASRNAVGFFTSPPLAAWYSTNLNATGNGFVNLTGSTQLRLRFQTDDNNDLGADYLKFFSGDPSPTYRPALIIEYYIP